MDAKRIYLYAVLSFLPAVFPDVPWKCSHLQSSYDISNIRKAVQAFPEVTICLEYPIMIKDFVFDDVVLIYNVFSDIRVHVAKEFHVGNIFVMKSNKGLSDFSEKIVKMCPNATVDIYAASHTQDQLQVEKLYLDLSDFEELKFLSVVLEDGTTVKPFLYYDLAYEVAIVTNRILNVDSEDIDNIIINDFDKRLRQMAGFAGGHYNYTDKNGKSVDKYDEEVTVRRAGATRFGCAYGNHVVNIVQMENGTSKADVHETFVCFFGYIYCDVAKKGINENFIGKKGSGNCSQIACDFFNSTTSIGDKKHFEFVLAKKAGDLIKFDCDEETHVLCKGFVKTHIRLLYVVFMCLLVVLFLGPIVIFCIAFTYAYYTGGLNTEFEDDSGTTEEHREETEDAD